MKFGKILISKLYFYVKDLFNIPEKTFLFKIAGQLILSLTVFCTLDALFYFLFLDYAQFLSPRAHICIRMTGKDGGVLTSEETKWKNQN